MTTVTRKSYEVWISEEPNQDWEASLEYNESWDSYREAADKAKDWRRLGYKAEVRDKFYVWNGQMWAEDEEP